jgi:hypothetical protein
MLLRSSAPNSPIPIAVHDAELRGLVKDLATALSIKLLGMATTPNELVLLRCACFDYLEAAEMHAFAGPAQNWR